MRTITLIIALLSQGCSQFGIFDNGEPVTKEECRIHYSQHRELTSQEMAECAALPDFYPGQRAQWKAPPFANAQGGGGSQLNHEFVKMDIDNLHPGK